jgi:hypothetical protein
VQIYKSNQEYSTRNYANKKWKDEKSAEKAIKVAFHRKYPYNFYVCVIDGKKLPISESMRRGYES